MSRRSNKALGRFGFFLYHRSVTIYENFILTYWLCSDADMNGGGWKRDPDVTEEDPDLGDARQSSSLFLDRPAQKASEVRETAVSRQPQRVPRMRARDKSRRLNSFPQATRERKRSVRRAFDPLVAPEEDLPVDAADAVEEDRAATLAASLLTRSEFPSASSAGAS